MVCVQVLAPVTVAVSVPAVKASQTLSAYTVDTFTQSVREQVGHMKPVSLLYSVSL